VIDPRAQAASPRLRLGADLVLVGITGVWGVTFVVVKDALSRADPFTFLALRFAIGALIATALAGGQFWDAGVIRRGLVLGLFLFAGFALQTMGLVYTSEARSAFITGLAVVLVPLASFALFRRLPHLPSLVGVVLAFLGLHLLTSGVSDSESDAATSLGDLLTLGCAVSFAVHITLTEKFSRGVPALALVSVQLWLVALLGAVCVPLVDARVEWKPDFVAAVLFSGVVASAGCIALQTWAQARTTAVRAAVVFSLEPVFAALVSVGLGRERLDWEEVVGGSLTVLAVVVSELGNAFLARRESSSRPTER
jgi:drug/metabolite transporter (DMT)-like permease